MKHWERIGRLSGQRSELKQKGEYRAAIPLQLEIIELLIDADAPQSRIAMAHNYASVLYWRAKLHSSAEWHARQALRIPAGESARDHESRGCYNIMLARILASQYRFDEAAAFGEEAIRKYGFWHTPPDEFLTAIAEEVETMRNRTWSKPGD